jgi:hypothetical protein
VGRESGERGEPSRRLALYLLLIPVVYLLLEVTSLAIFFVANSEMFSFERIEQRRSAALSGATRTEVATIGDGAPGGWLPGDSLVLHPFLGYVRRPGAGGEHGVTDHGFLEKGDSGLAQGNGREITVAITGGSFAENHFTSLDADDFAYLAEIPGFRGARVRLISLAMRGYKQPQQLAAVAYLLALGEAIDVLINIDGFNEIALSREIWRHNGIFPAYPYHWAPLTRKQVSPAFLRAVGEIGVLRNLRARVAGAFRHLRYSVTAGVFWDALDRAIALEIAEAQATVESVGTGRGEALPYFRAGPRGGPPEGEFYRWASDLWFRSSLALHHLARAHGVAYFHFLQPNQYVPDSKVLTERELRSARIEGSGFDQYVRAGYPHLRREGRRLQSEGVAFRDLTAVFEDEEGTIYIDRCCHVGERGNRIVAAEIAREIRAHFEAADSAPPHPR